VVPGQVNGSRSARPSEASGVVDLEEKGFHEKIVLTTPVRSAAKWAQTLWRRWLAFLAYGRGWRPAQ
jgi:hypothetical protein